MAHRSVVYGLFLGMVGLALASGCVVESDDDDDGGAGEGGESSGGSSTGGSSTGGSSTGGRGGSATGGSSTGGSAGMDTEPECDPDSNEPLDNTYYPNCTARPGNSCEECIEANCCAESKICYGYDPGNVCGWGGPDLDGDGESDGEITCYIECAQEYVADNDGIFDNDGIDECTAACTTEVCGQIGNATQDLAVCLQENCEEACWPAQ